MLIQIRLLLTRARRRRMVGASIVLVALLASIVGNALTFYFFESGQSLGDSFWYSVISITTIGYGDLSATEIGSRIGTVVFITVVGLTAFTAAAVGAGLADVAVLRPVDRHAAGFLWQFHRVA